MRLPGPQDVIFPALEYTAMLAEAQLVVGLRLAGMLGLWPMAADEGLVMVAEKVSAGQDAAMAALCAGISGASPGEMALAALAPVRSRTRANAHRLMQG